MQTPSASCLLPLTCPTGFHQQLCCTCCDDPLHTYSVISHYITCYFVISFRRVFQGPSYSCGFSSLPTFGKAAAAWTWRFDFQQQYIGAGMLVPHVVAWSMMLGAVLSWGVMWPLLSVSFAGGAVNKACYWCSCAVLVSC